MKKFIKFTLGVIALAAIIGGVLYCLKKILMKDTWDDLEDDFDDEFDEFDDESEDEAEGKAQDESRKYVKLNVDEASMANNMDTEQPKEEVAASTEA